jgi:hypothetical protein
LIKKRIQFLRRSEPSEVIVWLLEIRISLAATIHAIDLREFLKLSENILVTTKVFRMKTQLPKINCNTFQVSDNPLHSQLFNKVHVIVHKIKSVSFDKIVTCDEKNVPIQSLQDFPFLVSNLKPIVNTLITLRRLYVRSSDKPKRS